MIKSLILAALMVLATSIGYSQFTVYSEDFDGAQTWTLNTVIGAEGSNPNVWYISCQEDGEVAGNCGTACVINDNSLHIGTDPAFFGDNGALYLETGAFITDTDRRAESPDISTVGQTNLSLEFDMIGWGGNAQDVAEVYYSTDGGGTWNLLAGPITSVCCGSVPCDGFTQGLWQHDVYPLPVTCENIPNLRIGFVWRNVDDGVATDPSIAVDDVQITTPNAGAPSADFNANLTTICEGDCIDFTDASTVSTNPAWSWTFTGAATATSNVQNPTGICYNTAGVYDVQLDVTDDGGNDTEIKVGYITVVAPPNAGSNAAQNLCNNTTLDLNTLIPGADPGTWVETSGTPSGQFNAGTGVLDGNGLTIGNVYTFDYTVTATAPCIDATTTMTITIIDCSGGPTADFSASQTIICEGDCIDFTDMSTVGGNPTWSWTFTGATTATSTTQNPTNICYPTAGMYQVELVVTDVNGNDTETKVNYITVNAAPITTATVAPNDTVCLGDNITLTGGGATSYTWDNGVTDGVAFAPPNGTTTYTVTGTDAGCSRDFSVQVYVYDCDSLISDWSINGNALDTIVCRYECVTLMDESSGDPQQWLWSFNGAADPDTVYTQNPEVCFDSVGVFNINLQVIENGDTSDFSQLITVLNGPLVIAGVDTIIIVGGMADLIATGSSTGTWEWTPDYNIGCTTCDMTTADPYETTTYTATLTDSLGCTGWDTVKVFVNFIEAIDVPTAFSPNDDGNNDILFVKGIGIENLTFSIFNKYGQKVFETDDQNIGWDGTFNGRNENSGVFTWLLEYQLVNGRTGTLKGNTTLIR